MHVWRRWRPQFKPSGQRLPLWQMIEPWASLTPGYSKHTMVNRNLIRGLDLNDEEWQQELDAALEGVPADEIDWGSDEVAVNQIVEGKVLRIEGGPIRLDASGTLEPS